MLLQNANCCLGWEAIYFNEVFQNLSVFSYLSIVKLLYLVSAVRSKSKYVIALPKVFKAILVLNVIF